MNNKIKIALYVLIFFTLIISCKKSNKTLKTENMGDTVSKIEALKTAENDATKYYSDLSVYEIIIKEVGPNWVIDYELIDKESNGGGPHYIISSETGEIIEKRYEQ